MERESERASEREREGERLFPAGAMAGVVELGSEGVEDPSSEGPLSLPLSLLAERVARGRSGLG